MLKSLYEPCNSEMNIQISSCPVVKHSFQSLAVLSMSQCTILQGHWNNLIFGMIIQLKQ